MSIFEINFDGIIGPSHNYAGLSFGNLASSRNAGFISYPRAAALQGLEKMRHNLRLGLKQGILLPHWRPDIEWLSSLGTTISDAEPHIRAAALSASPMWAANAATVSPAFDTSDGRTHLTVANLMTMPHRSHEWRQTQQQLRVAFADDQKFVIHPPIAAPFGDEGAANHMRLSASHLEPGVEIFVYGNPNAHYPARQNIEASKAVARLHQLDPKKIMFVEQSAQAIAAGAFHNDVVAVANENVLFVHEQAFENPQDVYSQLRSLLPSLIIIEVPAKNIDLKRAVQTYMFNAQLVSLPSGGMALILPTEAREDEVTWTWLTQMVSGNGPIRRLLTVDVRQSMANGGGPACLRLRVIADPIDIDPRFLVNEKKINSMAEIINRYWPERIDPTRIDDSELIAKIEQSWLIFVDHLHLSSDLIG